MCASFKNIGIFLQKLNASSTPSKMSDNSPQVDFPILKNASFQLVCPNRHPNKKHT